MLTEVALFSPFALCRTAALSARASSVLHLSVLRIQRQPTSLERAVKSVSVSTHTHTHAHTVTHSDCAKTGWKLLDADEILFGSLC